MIKNKLLIMLFLLTLITKCIPSPDNRERKNKVKGIDKLETEEEREKTMNDSGLEEWEKPIFKLDYEKYPIGNLKIYKDLVKYLLLLNL